MGTVLTALFVERHCHTMKNAILAYLVGLCSFIFRLIDDLVEVVNGGINGCC